MPFLSLTFIECALFTLCHSLDLKRLSSSSEFSFYRRINGRRIVCHDDLCILKTAEEKDAVVVSNDAYRDLLREHPQYRRIRSYSSVCSCTALWMGKDPLGRYGPRLQQFLSNNSTPSTAQLCPYARKCTYGSKCKYFHPERPNGMHISVTDRLMREKNQSRPPTMRPLMHMEGPKADHRSVGRTRSLNIDPRSVHESKATSARLLYDDSLAQCCWSECVRSTFVHHSRARNWNSVYTVDSRLGTQRTERRSPQHTRPAACDFGTAIASRTRQTHNGFVSTYSIYKKDSAEAGLLLLFPYREYFSSHRLCMISEN
ncbi:hypothetical protein OSTOST_12355 [Ostertagia ostertagi]